jgi:hypothetical protein
MWLQADPDGCIELLLQRKPPIPAEDALQVLQSTVPDLACSYLESAISLGIAPAQRFHSKLAAMYGASLTSTASPEGQVDEAVLRTGALTVPEAVERLLALVRKSPYVNAMYRAATSLPRRGHMRCASMQRCMKGDSSMRPRWMFTYASCKTHLQLNRSLIDYMTH